MSYLDCCNLYEKALALGCTPDEAEALVNQRLRMLRALSL